jgi:hypothetical protein
MLCWQPTRRTRPSVPAHRDNSWRHTHADGNGHTKSHFDRNAKSYRDDNAKPHCNGNRHANSHSHGNAEFNGQLNPDTSIMHIV